MHKEAFLHDTNKNYFGQSRRRFFKKFQSFFIVLNEFGYEIFCFCLATNRSLLILHLSFLVGNFSSLVIATKTAGDMRDERF